MKTFLSTCLKYYTHPLCIKLVLYQLLVLTVAFVLLMVVFAFIWGPAPEPINYLISWAFLEVALLASYIVAVPLAILTYIFLIKDNDQKI